MHPDRAFGLELQFAMSHRICCRSSSGVGCSDSQWLDSVDSGFNIGDGAGGCSDSGVVAGKMAISTISSIVVAGNEDIGSKSAIIIVKLVHS